MFLREGSQLRATSLSVFSLAVAGVAMLGSTGLGLSTAMAAERGNQGATSEVQLPREILPWRRDAENAADRLLASALKSRRAGNRLAADRLLRELIRNYPGTHAATAGQRELALRGHQLTGIRRGLGMPSRPAADGDRKWSAGNPIAGWETSVKPDPENIREALIEAAGDRVFFKEGSAQLSARARMILKKQARWLRSKPDIEVRVVGHADDRGSSQANMRLSHDRAVTVRKHLIRNGVPPKRLHVFSYGRAQPIAICTVRTCAAQNRRVVTEIRVAHQTAATK